jgi:hypothetical protein
MSREARLRSAEIGHVRERGASASSGGETEELRSRDADITELKQARMHASPEHVGDADSGGDGGGGCGGGGSRTCSPLGVLMQGALWASE